MYKKMIARSYVGKFKVFIEKDIGEIVFISFNEMYGRVMHADKISFTLIRTDTNP